MRFGQTRATWPPGQAWATYQKLTPVLSGTPGAVKVKPFSSFSRFGLYPNAPSDASLALTAPDTSFGDSVASALSWVVTAGVVVFAGGVLWTAMKGGE